MSTPTSPDRPTAYLSAAEIRARFIEFFAERGHTVVPSASLVPGGDQTLLFTNSGMVQFKDALAGVEKRDYVRAVDYQRVLRVAGKHNDFEEVGRTPRHHTLFEMLGNWSFGDYFKREAIHWAWQFLTRDLGIPGDRLAATVYTTDDLAHSIWKDEIGLPPERLVRWGDFPAGDEKNWWRMADVGPCGPCSELHYDRGAHLSEGPECVPDHSEHCPRWLEIWNLVFMEFELHPDRSLTPLPAPGVDTGMGLERIASVVQGVASNYDTDLFAPIHARMRELLGHDPEGFEAERFSYQVIADHSRAVTFLIADGVLPANEGRGYVLRRIMRRAIRHGRLLGRTDPFLGETAKVVIDTMAAAYPHLADRRDEILGVIEREERQFNRTLEAGVGHLEEALIPLTSADRTVGRLAETLPADAPVLPGSVAFRLHDTYGFPIDLTVELAAEYGVRTDLAGFQDALAEQRDRSRSHTKTGKAEAALAAARYAEILGRTAPTEFLGYETTAAMGRVVTILRDGVEYESLEAVPEIELRVEAGAQAEIVLDRTPFYAESGGQVSDIGVIRAADGTVVFEVEDVQRVAGTQTAGLTVHRGTLRGEGRPGGHPARRGGRRASRAHDAQPHGHAPAPSGAAQRGGGAGAPGGLAGPPGLPALRLPVRPRPHRGREAGDRARGPRRRPRGPPGERRVDDHGRGPGRRRRCVLRREVRRAGPDDPRGRLQPRAVRRHPLPRVGPDRQLRDHRRAEHRVRGPAHRGRHGCRRGPAHGGAVRPARPRHGRPSAPAARRRSRRGSRPSRTSSGRRSAASGPGSRRAAAPSPRTSRRGREEVAPGVAFVGASLDLESIEALKGFAKDIRAALPSGVIALGLDADEPQLFVTVSEDLVLRGHAAGALVQAAVTAMDGRGGGRPEMAQGKGSRREGLGAAITAVRAAVVARAAAS